MKLKRKKLAALVAFALTLNMTSSFNILATEKTDSSKTQVGELKRIGENLVSNPGFEEGEGTSVPGWKVWNGGSESIGIDSNNAYEGAKCGYIVNSSSLGNVLINLKPHTTYKYSAYVKLENKNDFAILGVKDFGGTELKEVVSGNEYVEYSITFTTGNQSRAEVYLWDGSGISQGGKAYIDNVSVEEVPYEGDVEAKLNVSELQIAIGETYELDTKVIPENAVSTAFTYKSSDNSIVTVDENGKLKAIGSGEATITVSPINGGIDDTCTVRVTDEKTPWYPNKNEDSWSLTMEDEFNGNSIDESKWTVRGKEYKTYHRSDMVYVEDGKLKLDIAKEPDGQVVLGRIDNHEEDFSKSKAKFDQKYGFFEASAKIPPTEQTYFAFWMFNYPGVFNIDGTGREGTEIDIAETVFQGDFTESTLHWDGYEWGHRSTSSHRKSAPNIHDGFHRYGLEWTEDTLTFYFDGKETWTYRGPAVPWVREILIFSSGLGMWGEGNINNADLPYTAEVDWVRVYSKDGYEEREDNIEPLLYGLDDIKIGVNSSNDLLDNIWAVDNKDDEKELSKKIIIDESNLNRNEEGEYKVSYTITDEAGNLTTNERNVWVVDEEELRSNTFNEGFEKGNLDKWSAGGETGENINEIIAGVNNNGIDGNNAYVSPKNALNQIITVKPNTTYRVTAKVKAENANERVEVGVEGYGGEKKQSFIYGDQWQETEIIFSTDIEHSKARVFAYNGTQTGNILIDYFIVEEIENPDKENPVIVGIEDTRILKGTEFDPKEGVSVTDNIDENLTVWLDVQGRVDINKPGTYELVYKVVDTALNTTKKVRKVTVYEEESTDIEVNPVRDLFVSEKDKNSIKLSWKEPKATEGLESYIIFKDGKKIKEISTENLEYVVNKLNRHTIYNFKVAAKYSNGKISDKESVTIRTLR